MPLEPPTPVPPAVQFVVGNLAVAVNRFCKIVEGRARRIEYADARENENVGQGLCGQRFRGTGESRFRRKQRQQSARQPVHQRRWRGVCDHAGAGRLQRGVIERGFRFEQHRELYRETDEQPKNRHRNDRLGHADTALLPTTTSALRFAVSHRSARRACRNRPWCRRPFRRCGYPGIRRRPAGFRRNAADTPRRKNDRRCCRRRRAPAAGT